ncbi:MULTISPECIES: MFS transporter [Nitrospirillum]|uniref:MFS transporter n=1 Tax=Nitrospirillum amazonense TaxID=28077 RepID=UPI001B3BED77|nr:MFS transporter [Nitrospirillum amazonense]MEC4593206.1 MFS transporter [Nitrospirillum amazonense]
MGWSWGGRSLGPQFNWLWTAYAVSVAGTWLAWGGFPLIAVTVLHCGPAAVSLMMAGGLAAGAIAAIPMGPWAEFRAKRGVLITMDLVRFAAIITVPIAYPLGWLSYAQLVVVSIIVATANITFTAASGAYIKALVPREDLISANAVLESTSWVATIAGPPLGGMAIGLMGPVATVLVDAVSYLLSALGIGMIKGRERPPTRPAGPSRRLAELLDGWRFILAHPTLWRLFLNTVLVNAMIMVSAPLMAFLMLGPLAYTPWQYGLAFGLPCVGGLIGSRLARPLAARLGQRTTILVTGTLRAGWSLGLAFIGPGTPGLVLVIAVQFGLVLCCGTFNPVMASFRLEQLAADRVARTLSAWSVTNSLTTAALIALWGLLADMTSPRIAIAIAGILMLATPILLPWRQMRPAASLAPGLPS